MIYVDTNIFIYAIENHPKYATACKKVLVDIMNKKIEVACSILVLAELLNVLVKMRKLAGEKLDVKGSIQAVLSLPITWFDMDFFVLENAAEYKYNISGIDYIHIATMEINAIKKAISADTELDKVDFIERIDPLEYY